VGEELSASGQHRVIMVVDNEVLVGSFRGFSRIPPASNPHTVRYTVGKESVRNVSFSFRVKAKVEDADHNRWIVSG
jgi:hypothetical protein